MPRDGAQTLSDVREERMTFVCGKSPRRGSYSTTRLRATRGDLKLTDFLSEIAADCPRWQMANVYDRCDVKREIAPV